MRHFLLSLTFNNTKIFQKESHSSLDRVDFLIRLFRFSSRTVRCFGSSLLHNGLHIMMYCCLGQYEQLVNHWLKPELLQQVQSELKLATIMLASASVFLSQLITFTRICHIDQNGYYTSNKTKSVIKFKK